MARSPLMRHLRRLARDHAAASLRGVEPAQVREERAAALIGRREFMQGFGALGAAALASRPQAAKALASQPRIVVVGAGIAGLNAALTLQDAGLACTVHEAARRIGGRMHSEIATWRNGQKSEWCGEFIDSAHTTMLKLAQRFGLKLIDEVAAQPAGSTDTLYFRGGYYASAQADADFAPVNAALQTQINAAPTTLYNSYTPTGYYLDNISVYEWIQKYVPGGHGSSLGRYLESAYSQEYGLDTSEQSSLNLVYLLGYQPEGEWQIYGVSDQRFSILGGNQRLPEAIAASLPAGSVITASRLTKISRKVDGVYLLTFYSDQGFSVVEADHVILTLPFSVLRNLDYSAAGFSALKKTAIEQLGYGTNTKLALQFNQRYWNEKGPWGISDGNIFTDLFFQNTWESSRGIGAHGSATGVLTSYTGGSHGASFTEAADPYSTAAADPAVVKYSKTFLSQLENVWPGVGAHWNGLATLSRPWSDPHLLGSYSCWKVGQYTKFAGFEHVRQGNCHFAGEHCSTVFQGYMEGAAEQGYRAANQIITDPA